MLYQVTIKNKNRTRVESFTSEKDLKVHLALYAKQGWEPAGPTVKVMTLAAYDTLKSNLVTA